MNWPSCPKPNETGRFLASLSGACHRRPLNRKSQFATGNVQHATRHCAERRDRIDKRDAFVGPDFTKGATAPIGAAWQTAPPDERRCLAIGAPARKRGWFPIGVASQAVSAYECGEPTHAVNLRTCLRMSEAAWRCEMHALQTARLAGEAHAHGRTAWRCSPDGLVGCFGDDQGSSSMRWISGAPYVAPPVYTITLSSGS